MYYLAYSLTKGAYIKRKVLKQEHVHTVPPLRTGEGERKRYTRVYG
jgi:hypothetical protein